MIIYTNQGNPFGLKLLILSKLAKKDITVKVVNLSDPVIKDIKQLPILELDSGVQLFCTNSIAKFLLPNSTGNDYEINEWLEWSTNILAPALAHNFGAGHRADGNAIQVLNEIYDKLENTLSKNTFLTGNQLTISDVSVWSLLVPEGTLKNAVNVDNLMKWYNNILNLDEIKDALKIINPKDLNFTSLQHSNNFGGLHHIILPFNKEKMSSNENKSLPPSHLSTDSPTHVFESISEEEIKLAKMNFISVQQIDVKDEKIILPKKGERNVLITSALPYVNNVPHLGNIIGCVLSADIFARYSRICGYNTLFICGTDEYGTATETKAMAENCTPKEICDKYFEIHNGIYRWFGIGFDYFGRTTTPEQTEIVQSLFMDIYKKGYIIKESVEQLLCKKCDRFLADRFVEGTCPHPGCGYEDARGDQCDKCGKLVNAVELIRPRCKACTTAPVIRSSNQLFLDLPRIEPKLREWIEKSDSGWTNNARVISRAWLKEGLKPRCITRDLKWGVPVPLDEYKNKVFYVWFDAPIGYFSITKRYTKQYKEWWQPNKDINVELFQFMAKDNVPFHSVMFPATLLALNQGYTLVSHIMATEYLNYEDGKFSKSRGTGVFGNDAQDTGIPSDVWRYYLAANRPEGQDSAFSWNDLGARNNSELLNNLGNFINRALVFCEKNFDSTIPIITFENEDLILLALINREIKGYVHSMEKAKLRDGLRHVLSISRHGNQYIQSTQPWVLAKGNSEQKLRAATVIGISCNVVCTLAILLFPFMPTTSRKIFSQLNTKQKYLNPEKPFVHMHLPVGHKIGKPVPLFQKIEQNRIDELKRKYSGEQIKNDTKQTVQEVKTNFKTITEAEEAIKKQGDKVRDLKKSGIDKTQWQPEVNILLEMKKQLTELQAKQQNHSTESALASTISAVTIADNNIETKCKELEEQISKQANKVRELKANSASTVWKPEVDKLLALKQELATLSGKPVQPAPTKKGKNKKN